MSALKKVFASGKSKLSMAIGFYVLGMLLILMVHYSMARQRALNAIDSRMRQASQAASILIDEELAGKTGSSIGKEAKLSRLATTTGIDHLGYFIKQGSSMQVAACSSPVSGVCLTKCDAAIPEMLEAISSGVPQYLNGSGEDGSFRMAFLPYKAVSGEDYALCASTSMPASIVPFEQLLHTVAFPLVIAFILTLPLMLFHFSSDVSLKRIIKEKQAQLVHAGRLTAMGEMAAEIAHEINQPLCVIRGYVELLQASLADEPTVKERQLENSFDICVKSVDKASKIVNHMRSFVRLKSSEMKPASLRVPVEEGLSFFNEQIRLHNIQLDMHFEDGVPELYMDAQRFEQVVVNLVSNARYAVDEMGQSIGREFKKAIELRLSHDKVSKRVVFEVKDNGTGMPLDTLKRCGEPFFTTKKVGEGTGLGVSIVKEIIEDFGGRLEIESEQGKGSSFRASFPVMPDIYRKT